MSHQTQHNYYLVCDPATGKVVTRTHEWQLRLSHYEQIKVTRAVWKQHRSGGRLDTTHIHEPYLGRWIVARARVARNEARNSKAIRRAEKLDRDNLGT